MIASLSLAGRNLFRNKRRSILTALGMAVSVFLFTTLATVITSLDKMFEAAGHDPMLVVYHKGGLFHDLPESTKQRLLQVPGVLMVTTIEFYGGTYGRSVSPRDVFPSIGMEEYDVRAFWGGEVEVTDEGIKAFHEDREGALVGPMLLERFNWKIGQRVTLRGTARPVDLSFNIVGTAAFRTERGSFLFHRELLEEALGRPGVANVFYVRVRSTNDMPAVAHRIDTAMRNTSTPTRTVPLRQQMESIVAMIGDVRGIISSIAAMVLIAVLFVIANGLVLGTRERVREFAVLRALGFSKTFIATTVIAEACFLGLAGGTAGALVAWAVFGRGFAIAMGPLSGFQVGYTTVGLAVLLSGLVAVISSAGPALFAARVKIVQALRAAG